jgi:hypothetical protein
MCQEAWESLSKGHVQQETFASLFKGCNATQGNMSFAHPQDESGHFRKSFAQKRPQALIDSHCKCIIFYIPTLGRYCTASAT